MHLLAPLIIGIVEAVTEFLPISSTAHLLLVEKLLQTHFLQSAFFRVLVQLPPLFCLIFFYRKDIFSIITKTFKLEWRGFVPFFSLLNAFFATSVLGLLLKKALSLESGIIIPVCMVIGGAIFIRVSRLQEQNRVAELHEIKPSIAFLIGCAQAMSVVPGVSRLGSTLIAGAPLGLEKKNNIRFSFLLGILTLTAASMYELISLDASERALSPDQYLALAVCLVASSFVGAALLRILGSAKLKVWGFYRIAFGLIFWLL